MTKEMSNYWIHCQVDYERVRQFITEYMSPAEFNNMPLDKLVNRMVNDLVHVVVGTLTLAQLANVTKDRPNITANELVEIIDDVGERNRPHITEIINATIRETGSEIKFQ